MEKPKRAQKRKLDTAKADLQPLDCRAVEGRASVARRSPKGLRRTAGPQSMGATLRRTGRPRVGPGRARYMGAKALLIHPPDAR